jgi:osmotically-inducible protein OsmY
MKAVARHWLAAALLLPGLAACVPVAVVGGVTAGAMTSADRRSLNQQGVDYEVERRASNRLSENFGDRVHVNVSVYDQTVLATGEAPTPELLAEVEALLKMTPNVKRLVNEIRVARPSAATARANDGLITAAVKARFGKTGAFELSQVKVVTEFNSVYLMGKVSQKEADVAIDTARNTQGVARVVNVLDVLPEEQIKRLDAVTRGGAEQAPSSPAK